MPASACKACTLDRAPLSQTGSRASGGSTPASLCSAQRAKSMREPLFGLASPLFAAPSRKPAQGRFFIYTIKPGASQVGWQGGKVA